MPEHQPSTSDAALEAPVAQTPPRDDRAGWAIGAALATFVFLGGFFLAAARSPVTRDAPPAIAPLLIDPNTADASMLRLLPGIGPGLAKRIIADREANGPFRSIDDLERVDGIGPRTVDRLAPHASVRQAP